MRVAIVGAGVSGLTCAVLFAEKGYSAAIFAADTGQRTTSAAAGAIWYPYDAEPFDAVIQWALQTRHVLVELSRRPGAGVSMIELRTICRTGDVQIPDWAIPLHAHRFDPSVMSGESPALSEVERVETSLTVSPPLFSSGFVLQVPLTDTTIYLDYLAKRFVTAGGVIHQNVRFQKFEEVGREFDLIVNCTGIGAKDLVADSDLEPHRGQVAIVGKLNLAYAVVCDDAPLMYAIPRSNDCLFGGTNELSDNYSVDPATTEQIVNECSRALNIPKPKVTDTRVGLRPFRKAGVRLCADRLEDGRALIHNYGHGGSGFTLSWGCAEDVLRLAESA